MTNGKVCAWDALTYKVSTGAVSTATGKPSWMGWTRQHSAALASYYTPDSVNFPGGFAIEAWSSETANGIIYNGPSAPTGGYADGGSGYSAFVECTVRFVGLTIYATFYSKWRTVCSSIEIYLNGSLSTTLSGFDYTTDGLSPEFLKPFGVGFSVTRSCSIGITGDPGGTDARPYTNYDATLQLVQTVGCGVRLEKDSSFVEMPVTFPTASVPTISGSDAIDMGSVTCTNSWDIEIECETYSRKACHYYKEDSLGQNLSMHQYSYGKARTGSLFVEADWDYSYVRMKPGFVELIERPGFPKCRSRGYKEWLPSDSYVASGDDPTTANSYADVYGRLSSLLSTVGDSAHTIEGPSSQTVYSGLTVGGTINQQFDGVSYIMYDGVYAQPGLPYFTGETWPNAKSGSASYSFPYSVDAIADNSQMAPYLSHAEMMARYGNYIASPNWSLWGWYPPDSTGSLKAWEWPVDSDRCNASEYWAQLAVQHCTHPSLPTGENHRTRLFNVADCVYKSGHTPFVKTYVTGQETSWLGIRNFQTEALDLPASKQYSSASSGLWTFENCTASFGTNLTLTPTGGATTIKARVQLGSWGSELYMFPHASDRLMLDWISTNISQVRGYMKSIDGSSRALVEHAVGDGYTAKAEICAIPRGKDTKYAGSHAQDYGCGVVTDTGSDLKPAGISAATMADPERSMAFMILGGGTARYLEIEIDCTGVVEIEYPTLYASNTGWVLLQESSFNQLLIRSNGPGLRIGGLTWNDGNTLLSAPVVKELPDRMTVVDALCTMRALRGDNPTSGVTTQLSSLYDSYEGQSIQNSGSITSYALILPIGDGGEPVFAFVNTYSELPAIWLCPRKELDPATWQETGDWNCKSYVWSEEKRYIVNGGLVPLHVRVGTSQWTSISPLAIDGWQITEHSHSVDNTEICDIYAGDEAIASARPWWGWLFAYAAGDTHVLSVHSCADDYGQEYIVCTRPSGEAAVLILNENGLAKWSTISGISAESAQIMWNPSGLVTVVYDSEGAVYRVSTLDFGNTWSTPAMVGTGTSPACFGDWETGSEYIAAYDSGWQLLKKDSSETLFSLVGPITSAVGDGKTSLHIPGNSTRPITFCASDGSGGVRMWRSIDFGKHWTEV